MGWGYEALRPAHVSLAGCVHLSIAVGQCASRFATLLSKYIYCHRRGIKRNQDPASKKKQTHESALHRAIEHAT